MGGEGKPRSFFAFPNQGCAGSGRLAHDVPVLHAIPAGRRRTLKASPFPTAKMSTIAPFAVKYCIQMAADSVVLNPAGRLRTANAGTIAPSA